MRRFLPVISQEGVNKIVAIARGLVQQAKTDAGKKSRIRRRKERRTTFISFFLSFFLSFFYFHFFLFIGSFIQRAKIQGTIIYTCS
jgi:hypothetical protein